MKPKKRVLIKASSNLYYAIGLITTDGYLSIDGRHISFTSKDEELAKLFRSCLGINNVIGKKASGYQREKKYYVVQFGDIVFYQWCLRLGLMPNKSKKLTHLNIPDKYFFDFLRGCFDGDGTSYAYWDPRWRSSYMFYSAIASASPAFLIWLQKTINRLINIKGRIVSSCRSQQLRFAKKETKILFKKMYRQKNSAYLKRKFDKLQNFLKIDFEHAEVVKVVNTQD